MVGGVGGILGSEVLAWRPAGGSQDLLAECVGVACPVVVVGVCLYQLPPVMKLVSESHLSMSARKPDLLGAERPILKLGIWFTPTLKIQNFVNCDKNKILAGMSILPLWSFGLSCPT